jgi:hypothetical protein
MGTVFRALPAPRAPRTTVTVAIALIAVAIVTLHMVSAFIIPAASGAVAPPPVIGGELGRVDELETTQAADAGAELIAVLTAIAQFTQK